MAVSSSGGFSRRALLRGAGTAGIGIGGAALLGTGAAAPLPASASAARRAVGAAPPEWHPSTGSWAGPNYDLANTRRVTHTSINSDSVARLRVKWRFPLSGTGFFGGFSSNPIVVRGVVYIIDLQSIVYALDQQSGKVLWQRSFDSVNIGPNGVAYGYGLLFGTTHAGVFALDPATGNTVWSRELTSSAVGGVDIAPQLYDGKVVVSTVPSALDQYTPGAMGMVSVFDARTGAVIWEFNTVKDGELWGDPTLNSGGGLWYPPAVDKAGRIFLSVCNPAPFPGTTQFPNGTSRPGPNLYSNSLVALDSETGKLLWYYQVAPHDIRDYDLQISAIITEAVVEGVLTEIVVVAGKMGYVYAFRAHDGKKLWQLEVGIHQNDTGPLPDNTIIVFPGTFGGVETPMALSEGRVFVPWVDAGMPASSTSYDIPDLTQGKGGILAADVATGWVCWKRDLPQMALGAATVAKDVVFTSDFSGAIYALDTRTGRTLWTDQARAGINSFPAVCGDMLFVGAGTPQSSDSVPELIAYSL